MGFDGLRRKTKIGSQMLIFESSLFLKRKAMPQILKNMNQERDYLFVCEDGKVFDLHTFQHTCKRTCYTLSSSLKWETFIVARGTLRGPKGESPLNTHESLIRAPLMQRAWRWESLGSETVETLTLGEHALQINIEWPRSTSVTDWDLFFLVGKMFNGECSH